MKVFKLMGEGHDIREHAVVYSSREKALEGLKEWEGWLGMSIEEALDCEEAWIEEWTLVE